MPTCEECGEEFDSERGLHVHQGQVHGEDSSGTSSTVSDSGGSLTFELKATHALLFAFVVGIFAGGFFMSSLNAVTGVTGATVQAPGDSGGGNQPSPSPSGDEGGSQGSGGVSVSNLDFKNDPVIGPQDAPVTVVSWEDYQCPFCKRFEQNT
ncbi:MAG: thioredoxin domain-containing protein, partial [Candidatus Nanohaloarchaea archaeon]